MYMTGLLPISWLPKQPLESAASLAFGLDMYMPGEKMGDCKVGENYFDVHSGVAPHGAAVALFMSLVVVCLGGFLADRVEM